MAKLSFEAVKIESTNNKVQTISTDGNGDGGNTHESYPSISAVSTYVQNQLAITANDILSAVFPIGYVLTTFDDRDYTNYLGFTWEQVSGKFLFATDGVTGESGGEAQHTLIVDETPTHSHLIEHSTDGGLSWQLVDGILGRADGSYTSDAYMGVTSNVEAFASWKGRFTYVGGGLPHNNMPPYVTVRMWRRIN